MRTRTSLLHETASRVAGVSAGWKAVSAVILILSAFAFISQPDLFVSNLIGGFIYGMILVLIALGLSLILGLMSVVNFAHGSLFMLGAYIAYQVVALSGLSFWAAIVIAPIAVGLVGILIEVAVLRRLYDQEPIIGLLATFGLTLMIDESIRAIWGSQPQQFDVPAVLSSSVSLGVTTISTFRLFEMVVSVLVVAVVYLLVTQTKFGLTVRAGVQDAEMTEFLGVDLPKRFTLMFFIGAAIAGLGGVLRGAEVGLDPSLGGKFIILTFVVVVLGGIGSLFGSVVSGILIGEAIFMTPVILGSAAPVVRSIGLDSLAAIMSIGSLGQLMPYLLMIVVLLTNPRGLFGKEGFLE